MAQYLQQFIVEGCYNFPADMLRYDTCYPQTTGDATSIQFTRYDGEDYSTPRQVRLARIVSRLKGEEPTYLRWISFGWKVVEGSVKTLR